MRSDDSLLEAIAAKRMAEKLQMRIESHQREIANLCAGVCPMQAQVNLLGQMSTSLATRSYPDVREVLAHWEQFAGMVEQMLVSVQETGALVRGFCEFYEASNGATESHTGGK